ncbi:LacI family DNA-binding transcriptional regulator [Neoroseomonas oryzicola]|uniref:LacI family DNA-binding transcriptional regulator n=1 Tax=Neoroseomonas oryzicola TaxID=535904 RepID=A0A9X9WE89_9PROT|nr:LacI family DNA-binding transcriptional regulator [Neoroseomonas oryzicola]MBR0658649.1 LacI family DNA-binding transcriptional regulator [Neoroseomonas oryzicola]NKE17915.1 LacI family DNA-binding transcriptional regulator [Neoroseomonas oryzicola]
MTDIAAAAGVSVMTVSRAYRNAGRVSEETRTRIAEAAARLGYVPNLAAAQLSSRRSRVIAATIPSLSHSQFGLTLQALSDPLREAGYQLLLADCGYSAEEELRAVATVLGHRPEGLVVIGVDHGEAAQSMIRQAGIPVVETWDLDQPPLDMAAGFSNRAAARRMAEYLIGTGRRRIGYVDFPAPVVRRFAERRRGFVEALEAAGLRVDLTLPAHEGVGGYARGHQAVEKLLQLEPRLDAIFCATDAHGIGAMLECQRRGIDVPAQIAITGIGDFDIAAEIPPGLTTVRLHAGEIGRSAAKLIIDRLAGAMPQEQVLDIGFEIIRRGSG